MHSARTFTPIGLAARKVFLTVGQSNASGSGQEAPALEIPSRHHGVLARDYRWRRLEEPTSDARNAVDTVSTDVAYAPGNGNIHSAWLKCFKSLHQASGARCVLVPCSKGSTTMADWMPEADRYDRGTLYGSMNARRRLIGKTPDAILMFGHESSALNPGDYPNYQAEWARLMSEFRTEMPGVPIIAAQLALGSGSGSPSSPTDESANHWRSFGGRRYILETEDHAENASNRRILGLHVVPTFDLSLLDGIHLDRTGCDDLAGRFALAIRQHVFGEVVNGTGPRVIGSLKNSTTEVDVIFDKAISSHADYDNQFRVYDSVSGLRTITGFARVTSTTANDTVRITLDAGTPAANTATVTYGQTYQNVNGARLANVVVDTDGIPAPAFSSTAI